MRIAQENHPKLEFCQDTEITGYLAWDGPEMQDEDDFEDEEDEPEEDNRRRKP